MSAYADALLRLAHRFVHGRRRAARSRCSRVGTRLTHVTRALRLPRPRAGAGRGRRDRAGLVRRHPARRDAAGLPGPLGPARDGPRRGRRGVQRRLGARRRRRCSASRWQRLQPDRAPGGVGQPAPRQGRLRAGPAGRRRRAAALSTTSSPATRWRPSPSCWRWSAVREVLPRADGLVARPARRSASAPWSRRSSPPRARRAPRCWSARTATAVGSVSGGCVEGAVYELAQAVVASGDAGARAVRRLRRRRVRGRPHLRRHPRRVRREGEPARPSPSSARSPPTSRPAARSPWPPSSSTPTRRGSAGGSSSGPTTRRAAGVARLARGPTTRSATTRSGCWRPGHNATLTYGPDGERRGEGMRVFVWAFAPQAADAGVRRDRLRGGGGPGRARSSATT